MFIQKQTSKTHQTNNNRRGKRMHRKTYISHLKKRRKTNRNKVKDML
jgi:hypothetical protein